MATSSLLLENGSFLLLEDGVSHLLLENSGGGVTPPNTSGQTVLTKGKADYHSGSTFTRKRFDELMAAERALANAERKADETQNKKVSKAVNAAALVAEQAIEALRANEAIELAETAKLTRALEGAARAKSVAETISQARAAQVLAKAILAELEEIEDEEAAIMLLLQ